MHPPIHGGPGSVLARPHFTGASYRGAGRNNSSSHDAAIAAGARRRSTSRLVSALPKAQALWSSPPTRAGGDWSDLTVRWGEARSATPVRQRRVSGALVELRPLGCERPGAPR